MSFFSAVWMLALFVGLAGPCEATDGGEVSIPDVEKDTDGTHSSDDIKRADQLERLERSQIGETSKEAETKESYEPPVEEKEDEEAHKEAEDSIAGPEVKKLAEEPKSGDEIHRKDGPGKQITIPPSPILPSTIPPSTIPPSTILPLTIPPSSITPLTIPPSSITPLTIPPSSITPLTIPPLMILPSTIPPSMIPPSTILPSTITPLTIPPSKILPSPILPSLKPPSLIPALTILPSTIPPLPIPPLTILPSTIPPSTIPPLPILPSSKPPSTILPSSKPPSTILPTESGRGIRLRGGTPTSGRIEVYIGGRWGTVCDDYFGYREARVACAQLGLHDGRPVSRTSWRVPDRTLDIALDNLGCVGTESSLQTCPHRGFWVNDCSHLEDVGVSCSRIDSEEANGIRLRGGTTTRGRIEVYIRRQWGTVCDDGFGNPEARVACKQLGFSGGIPLVISSSDPDRTLPLSLDNLRCTGTERSLQSCSHHVAWRHNCDHRENIGVTCC